MTMADNTSGDMDVWNDTLPSLEGGRGMYIAVSGNTGAGKSSLIRTVAQRASEHGRLVVGISERFFHRPYLRLMFAEPGRFAFPIQLQFMLQRHLVLLRHLGLGRTVIIERSHFDDDLFVRDHAEAGWISPAQLQAYRGLARVLHEKLPMPDVLVLINPEPQLSIARLRRAEDLGERPREFPSEEARQRWVFRWHELYCQLHADFRRLCKTSPQFSGTILLEHNPESSIDRIAAEVLNAILSRRPADLERV